MKFLARVLLCCSVATATRLLQHSRKVEELNTQQFKWGAVDLIDQMDRDLGKLSRSIGRARSFIQLAGDPAPTIHAKKTKFDIQGAVKQMDGMGPAQMPGMLVLLKGMYQSWKDKIGTANQREKSQKEEYKGQIDDLELKKRKYKGDANATQTYDKIEKYWKRQRDIAHRQYHTVLKIAHGGMMKFKSVMGAMEGAIDGKKPTSEQLKVVQQEPEVVLLQTVEQLSRWSKGALSQLRDSKNPTLG